MTLKDIRCANSGMTLKDIRCANSGMTLKVFAAPLHRHPGLDPGSSDTDD